MNAITTLHSDVMHMRDLKAKVNQTVQDTIVATHIVDGFRNQQQHGAYLKSHANFPLEYVSPCLVAVFTPNTPFLGSSCV